MYIILIHMELLVEPDVYSPSINDNGMYVDNGLHSIMNYYA